MFILNPYSNTKKNTIIGGIGGTITSASALATKLGISSGIITNFQIIGSDIHCNITADYSISINAFQNDMSLTKFIDTENKLKQLSNAFVFRSTGATLIKLDGLTHINYSGALGYNTLLETINLPSLTTMVSQGVRANSAAKNITIPLIESIEPSGSIANCFQGLASCEVLDMRKLKVYGSNPATTGSTNSGFGNLNIGCTIKVHEDMATSNSGNPHGALVWVKANLSAIVEFYDDAGNYVSTL